MSIKNLLLQFKEKGMRKQTYIEFDLLKEVLPLTMIRTELENYH